MSEFETRTGETVQPALGGTILAGMLRPVLAGAVLFMVLTGLVYPLATTGAARLLFRDQSQGGLISRNGEAVGSRVIGQHFTQPQYFHGRPSVTSGTDPGDPRRSISQPYNAAASAASNQGVLSRKLFESVSERAHAYRETNGLAAGAGVPVDAVTASASGLDPHISVANARLQAPRVARARNVPQHEVLMLLEQNTDQRQLGILGEPRVHVLGLNLALDEAYKGRPDGQ